MSRLNSIAVGDTIETRSFTPGNVALFMYNAAIWNPHRIHYDEPYTTQVEKHPGIVIDGPLQGDWLSQVVTEWAGDDGRLVSFEYSNRRAAYLGETLHSDGTIVAIDHDAGSVTLDLRIENESGEVTSPGRAVVHFTD